MSVENNPKKPSLDPQLVNQLLAGRQTPGEIEDLLKGPRKAFIEAAAGILATANHARSSS